MPRTNASTCSVNSAVKKSSRVTEPGGAQSSTALQLLRDRRDEKRASR
jgi:hypothetical protein